MVQWTHEHPYLFFTMFLFTLVALTGMVSEVSRAVSSNKDDKNREE